MIGVLRSPRKRKRLAYAIVIPLVLVGLVFAGAALLPKAEEDPPEVFSNKQAYNIAAHEKAVRLTRTDRKLVNRDDRHAPERRRQAARSLRRLRRRDAESSEPGESERLAPRRHPCLSLPRPRQEVPRVDDQLLAAEPPQRRPARDAIPRSRNARACGADNRPPEDPEEMARGRALPGRDVRPASAAGEPRPGHLDVRPRSRRSRVSAERRPQPPELRVFRPSRCDHRWRHRVRRGLLRAAGGPRPPGAAPLSGAAVLHTQ